MSSRNKAACHQLWVYMKLEQRSQVPDSGARNAKPAHRIAASFQHMGDRVLRPGIIPVHFDRAAARILGGVECSGLFQRESQHAPGVAMLPPVRQGGFGKFPHPRPVAPVELMDLRQLQVQQVARPVEGDTAMQIERPFRRLPLPRRRAPPRSGASRSEAPRARARARARNGAAFSNPFGRLKEEIQRSGIGLEQSTVRVGFRRREQCAGLLAVAEDFPQ